MQNLIEIYQWDAIDIKMKEHLSKNQLQLYAKIKHSRSRSESQKKNEKSQSFTRQHIKATQSIHQFLHKKQQRVKSRACLELRPPPETQKNQQKQSSEFIHKMSQAFIIQRYDFKPVKSRQQSQLVVEMTEKTQRPQFINQTFHRSHKTSSHQQKHNPKQKLKRQSSMISTSSSDQSLNKKQRNRKYKALSNSVIVKKISLESKKHTKNLSVFVQKKADEMQSRKEDCILNNFLTVSNFYKQGTGNMFMKQNSRPKTTQSSNHQSSRYHSFLKSTLANKKPLRL